ncbi:sortase A [Enterococcus sp. AZ135]|uniref:class A sortase n=1 Tax=unclassified Enterococcus TaxID=2608891 RepID=UPI003F261482
MKRKILGLLAVLCVLAGSLILFNKPIKNYFVKNTGEHYDISKVTKEELKKNKDAEATFDFDAVKPLNLNAILQSQLKGLTQSGDSNKADSGSNNLPVIASVAVPDVGICLPVFKGLQDDGLYYGAGTLSADQEMGEGNYGIASHRSDQADLLFTPLENVILGNKIYLTDLTNVYTYVTVRKEKVNPSAVEVLDEVAGRKIVTLLTCGDLYATTRIIVQGELESVTPMDQMSEEAAKAFNLQMKTY